LYVLSKHIINPIYSGGIMKNLDKIKETLFRIEPNNISFIKKMLPMYASQIDRKECSHAHIIFIDDDSKAFIDGVIFQADEDETFEQGTKFRNLIESRQPDCLKDLLLLLEIYCCDMAYAHKYREKFNNPSFRAIRVVDELLKESNGFLLWDYQIINLYCLFDEDPKKADNFLKQFNQKSPGFWNTARKLIFDNGITLEKTVLERSILGHVKTPKLKGAYNLYRLLFE
tara:strand:- start:1068 stop:1751 length:684 start_codon:yes stop_codon:yes gene_type:complete